MTDTELRKILIERLPDEILNRGGQILYSGIDTVRRGDFYFLGFNPAADGTNAPLGDMRIEDKNWSAYTCQCWMCKGKCDPRTCPKRGGAKHQKNVKQIMSQLGLDPKETFSTNFLFVESDDVPKLKKERFFRDHVDACWHVHKTLLAVVRPTYIVCLGNGKWDSAYSLVREKADDKSSERYGEERIGRCVAFKSFAAKFELDCGKPLETTVVGLLHPSYWQCPAGLARFIDSK